MNAASDIKMGTMGRMLYMDVLKCFAIFLVVAGHCIQYLLSSDYADELGYRIIYSFHMPLFMMIVGYFYSHTVRLGFAQMIGKKIRQLILPLTVWTFIIITVKQILVGIPTWDNYVQGWVNGLWFLKSAFLCCVLAYFVFASQRYLMLMGGIVLTISQLYPYAGLQLPFMFPCFLIGGMISKFDLDVSAHKSVMCICFTIFIVLVSMLDSDLYTNSTLAIHGLYVGSFKQIMLLRLYRIVMGIAGSIFFLSFFRIICSSKYKLGGLIPQIGQYTLIIYIMQSFILEWYLARHCNLDTIHPIVFNFIIVPILSFVLVITCFGIGYFISKSKYLSFFLLGKKLR